MIFHDFFARDEAKPVPILLRGVLLSEQNFPKGLRHSRAVIFDRDYHSGARTVPLAAAANDAAGSVVGVQRDSSRIISEAGSPRGFPR